MYTVGGNCPICGERMYLERLRCPQCGTVLEGAFSLSPLFRLGAEQIHFVELLVKHRGNIQRVGEELGLSYRTARNRMEEIAAALGYELPPEEARPRPGPERRREILEALQAGRLTSDQAIRLLRGEEIPGGVG
ncbi:MAG: DUF2089 domain-containing protein [Chloroflexia bacterium]